MPDDANFIVKFVYGKPGEEFPIKKINVNTGKQGLQGPRGETGSYENMVKTAAVDIPGHRFVSLNIDNRLVPTMLTDLFSRYSIVGFIENAVDAGSEVTIKTSGIMTDSSFSLTPHLPIFILDNGLFTCFEPETGWIAEAGIALTEHSFFIDISKTYYKE